MNIPQGWEEGWKGLLPLKNAAFQPRVGRACRNLVEATATAFVGHSDRGLPEAWQGAGGRWRRGYSLELMWFWTPEAAAS